VVSYNYKPVFVQTDEWIFKYYIPNEAELTVEKTVGGDGQKQFVVQPVIPFQLNPSLELGSTLNLQAKFIEIECGKAISMVNDEGIDRLVVEASFVDSAVLSHKDFEDLSTGTKEACHKPIFLFLFRTEQKCGVLELSSENCQQDKLRYKDLSTQMQGIFKEIAGSTQLKFGNAN
jgi:hypothetical protein